MTTAEERQLLENAARAYWGDEIDDVCSIEWSEADQAIAYTHADNQDHNGCDQTFIWNPKDDDGDAFRLAVKLELVVAHLIGRAVAARYDCCDQIEKKCADPYAATRRAITRAAAAIGEQMRKEGKEA